MKYQKQINDWFSNFEHRFEVGVPEIVAETATEFFKERFRKEDWDGQSWPQLSPKYAKNKTRGKGRILTKSGMLQASIRPAEVSAGRIVISAGNAKVPYAKVHNEGLRLRGVAYVKPYTHPNLLGKGRQQVQGHSRKYDFRMPKRQFMGHSQFLNQEIISRLTKAFNQ